ncbi:hypothetical protein BDB00DRAFT_344180 [Zychaea mexicana]|uniref:uncharacterized protein n=1 Tax=Zychaea mexicana TaxID=64656 RepID=UPI0022FE10F6|nr:uncharacterized protein BDB00DRAFT_344180 [Zychaea mexicana]KAI9494051.1 hypothetical protein BDB00DRAFT_344180 [Zychaea mexicana]
MPRLSRVATALGCLAFLGTQVSAQNLMNGQCVQNYDANTDYFPDKLSSTREDDAQYFEIEYHNNYKLVTDHRNEKQYYLVQCGTPVPTGIATDAIVHQIPVTSVGAVETTVVPYLEMLGVAETIHLIADSSMVTSTCFQQYRETSNNVTELSASNVTLADEQAAAVEVQFGTSFYTTVDDETVSTAEAYEPDLLGVAACWHPKLCNTLSRKSSCRPLPMSTLLLMKPMLQPQWKMFWKDTASVLMTPRTSLSRSKAFSVKTVS